MERNDHRQKLYEAYGDPRSGMPIATQEELACAVGAVLNRELGKRIPMHVYYEVDMRVGDPGECFVDIGLIAEEPKSRWKRLMQRIGLWFIRRAEDLGEDEAVVESPYPPCMR